MIWNKKPTIDKIERLSISGKSILKNTSDMYAFSIRLEHVFTETAKASLKPVIQDFVLAMNSKICANCFWLFFAHDFNEFWQYDQHEQRKITEKLTRHNPSLVNVCLDAFDISLLFSEISAETFSILKNLSLPNGEMLLMDVFDTAITAFHQDDIIGSINQLSQADTGMREVDFILNKNIPEIYIWYFDSLGAKKHHINIRCKMDRMVDVKNCMINVFNLYGIQLEFE